MNQLTWFFGIISIIQMAFLPGFIIARVFKLEEALPSRWALYFFLSLLANYVLVYSLTSLHSYNSLVLRIFVLIEALIALTLAWKTLLKCPSFRFSFPRLNWIGGLALVVLLAYAFAVIKSQGQVFGYCDPTVSYNPWALQWASDHFPSQSYDYPQLLPTNWSISYVLIGQLNWGLALEFFPSSIMALFAFFMMLLFWEAMRHEKSNFYALSLIISGLLIADLLSIYIGLGYADIPVAAIGLAAVFVLLNSDYKLKYILLGACLCAASALTKQAGLWLILVYPFLTYWIVKKEVPAKKMLLGLGLSILIMAVLALSWYGLVWWGPLKSGLEWSYLMHGIYHQASWSERLMLIWQKTGLFFWACLVLGIFYCFKRTPWRLPFFLIALPMVLIWAVFFSYDNRNLSLSLPFIGIMAAGGVLQLSQLAFLQRFFQCLKKFLLSVSYLEWLVVLLLGLGLMGGQVGFRPIDLNAYQIRAKQNIGYPDLNQMLDAYQQKQGLNGKILTAWVFLFNGIPESRFIQPLSLNFYGPNMLPNVTENETLFLKALKAYPDVAYILVDKEQQLSNISFYQYLATMQQAGKLKLIGETSHFALYKIMKPLD